MYLILTGYGMLLPLKLMLMVCCGTELKSHDARSAVVIEGKAEVDRTG